MNPSSIGGLQMLSNAAVEVNNDKDTPKNKTKKRQYQQYQEEEVILRCLGGV